MAANTGARWDSTKCLRPEMAFKTACIARVRLMRGKNVRSFKLSFVRLSPRRLGLTRATCEIAALLEPEAKLPQDAWAPE